MNKTTTTATTTTTTTASLQIKTNVRAGGKGPKIKGYGRPIVQ